MQSVSGIRLFGVRLGFLAVAVYWGVIFAGTHLPNIPSAVPRVNDKLMHFTAFFVLAMMLCYCTNSQRLGRRFAIIAAVCLGYAVFDESTQALVRGRTSDVWDFVADACGTLLAVGIYYVGRIQWGRRQMIAKY